MTRALAILLLAACREPVTVLRLTVSFDDGLGIDRLEVNVDGRPYTVPDAPRSLASGVRLAIVVADGLADTPLPVHVWGRANDRIVATGQVEPPAVPDRHRTVDADISLDTLSCREEQILTPDGACPDCPTGWLPADDFHCEPVLPDTDCGDWTMPIIGETECQPIGDCCAGDYGCADQGHGGDPVCHVNGTSIQEAINDPDRCPDGAWVVVARHDYNEDVTVNRPLNLAGRCAEMVSVRSVNILAGADGVEVRGLAVEGGSLVVEGTDADPVTDVVVEGVVVRGRGVFVRRARNFRMRHTILSGNERFGVRIEDSSAVSVEDVYVHDTRAAEGLDGWGVDVVLATGPAPTVRLSRVVIEENQLGVRLATVRGIQDSGETLPVLEEVVVRGTEGQGVSVNTNADLAVKNSLIAGSGGDGIRVKGSQVRIEGTVVEDGAGDGLSVGPRTNPFQHSVVWRSVFADNADAGISLEGVSADDDGSSTEWVAQLDVGGSLLLGNGRGIVVEDGADLTVSTSTLFMDNDEEAIRRDAGR